MCLCPAPRPSPRHLAPPAPSPRPPQALARFVYIADFLAANGLYVILEDAGDGRTGGEARGCSTGGVHPGTGRAVPFFTPHPPHPPSAGMAADPQDWVANWASLVAAVSARPATAARLLLRLVADPDRLGLTWAGAAVAPTTPDVPPHPGLGLRSVAPRAVAHMAHIN